MAPRIASPTVSTRLLSALLAAGDHATTERVRRVLAAAETLPEAASELGVSSRTASRWARLLGMPPRPLGRPDLRRSAPVAQP